MCEGLISCKFMHMHAFHELTSLLFASFHLVNCSYGLKSWEDTPIDLIEDGGCATMPTVPGLFSVRTPDSITLFTVDGETYVATANEGDDIGKRNDWSTQLLITYNIFRTFAYHSLCTICVSKYRIRRL